MKIDVIPYAAASRPELTENKIVVVIDVLRATSVMLTALSNGAREIVPALSPDDAIQKSLLYEKDKVVLGGERNALKIEGFHLGNSPLEYSAENVAGKTVVVTTSNGTKALNNSPNAKEVLIAAFLNASALVERIRNEKEVVLFCSGTNNAFSLDDGMCAAMIIDRLSAQLEPDLSDFAKLLLSAYRTRGNNNLELLLEGCCHLSLLKQKGFGKDVTFCLQDSIYEIVPQMNLIHQTIK